MGKKEGVQYKFEIGDWSNDGHGMYESIMVLVKNSEDLEADYQKGFEKSKLDVTKYCNEYEDRDLPREFLEKLDKSNFDLNNLEDYRYFKAECEDDDSYCSNYEDYFVIWMHIAKLGNEDLEWERIEPSHDRTIQPGGYGLFSH